MECYWTVNNSYWPPLHVSQYEVNTSWPPQQKSIVLQYWKPKINSFSYAEKKKMAYVHQLLDQPSQWQTSQQAGPGSVPKFTSTSITVKQLLIKNKKINQSKSSLLIYLFLFIFFIGIFTGNWKTVARKVQGVPQSEAAVNLNSWYPSIVTAFSFLTTEKIVNRDFWKAM